MSKAFTKDDDPGEDDVASALEEMNPLPPGVPNYMTVKGLAAFQLESSELERQISESVGPADELKRRLRFCALALQEAKVAGPPTGNLERVVFGTTVTVETEDAGTREYAIVGVFEADPRLNKISWLSPLAKALLGARLGDAVVVELPAGESELEILKISALD